MVGLRKSRLLSSILGKFARIKSRKLSHKRLPAAKSDRLLVYRPPHFFGHETVNPKSKESAVWTVRCWLVLFSPKPVASSFVTSRLIPKDSSLACSGLRCRLPHCPFHPKTTYLAALLIGKLAQLIGRNGEDPSEERMSATVARSQAWDGGRADEWASGVARRSVQTVAQVKSVGTAGWWVNAKAPGKLN